MGLHCCNQSSQAQQLLCQSARAGFVDGPPGLSPPSMASPLSPAIPMPSTSTVGWSQSQMLYFCQQAPLQQGMERLGKVEATSQELVCTSKKSCSLGRDSNSEPLSGQCHTDKILGQISTSKNSSKQLMLTESWFLAHLKFFLGFVRNKKTRIIFLHSLFHLLGFLFLMEKERQCFLGKDFPCVCLCGKK